MRAIGNNGDLSPWGSGTAFSEGLLNTPALVSPAGASQNAAPTFTWNTVTGADYYDVYISDLTSGALIRNPHALGSSWTPTGTLTPGDNYQWWVRAFSNTSTANASPWGSGATFTVTPLVTPTPATVLGTSATPTFNWNASAGANFYDVWVNDTTTGQAQVLRNTQVSGTSWTPPAALVPTHSYQWWVRSVNTSGDTSPWGNGTTFTIALLSSPTQLAPNNATALVLKPTFQWATVTGASTYDVWVDNLTTGQTEVLRNTQITGTSWTSPTPLVPGQKYQWWVRAFSADGDYSAWSNATFTEASNLIAPPAGAVPAIPGILAISNPGVLPTYTWSTVSGANIYEVWVNDTTTGQGEVLRTQLAGNSLTSLHALVPGHGYQWWVRAVTAGGAASGWGSGATFTAALLTSPTLIGPNSPVSAASVLLSWNTTGADTYDVWVDDKTTGPTQVVRTQVTSLSLVPQLLSAGHSYQWWVRALTTAGDFSNWSSSFTFSLT